LFFKEKRGALLSPVFRFAISYAPLTSEILNFVDLPEFTLSDRAAATPDRSHKADSDTAMWQTLAIPVWFSEQSQ
tara:strand:- start:364 stop:588 length:225 start_codon:yes stop_codon:yes gene_type:complete